MKWLIKYTKRILKILGAVIAFILLLVTGMAIYIRYFITMPLPNVADKSVLEIQREKVGDNFYRIGPNWLRKSKNGLWEEYVQGEPFERGVITGKLNKELLYKQEVAFTNYIQSVVPNSLYLRFLGLFARFFNRNLNANIPEEYTLEIYGESFSAPDTFNYIAPAYERMLNYHAAHDIGHMMQNFQLVGCTSFAAWNSRTTDSGLIIGRNCDFNVSDKFAEDKIIYFCNPAQGHKFAMITWGGMMGCLSGMNEKGLTVTINAAKSDIPTESAMPISILAREILQYAGNISEAYSIAKKRKTFVAESIMIGSASAHQTAIIEKSPARIALYYSGKDFILCTNHYQSDTFKNDASNLQNIAISASNYRYQRLAELMDRNPILNPLSAAAILRDHNGMNDKNIGIGNEKAINQFICHHSVIFQPEKLRFWVSTQPYQSGEYICYDLEKVFNIAAHFNADTEISETDNTISPDTFIYTKEWNAFLKYKEDKEKIREAIGQKRKLANESLVIDELIKSNPEYWESYYWAGKYFESAGDKDKAVKYLQTSLTKEINDKLEEVEINKTLKQLAAN